MARLTAVSALAVLWVAGLAGHAAAAGEAVRVGIYENAPKVYTDEAGEPAGLFVELIGEIADREGRDLEFVSCDWRVCLERLEAADIDLMPDVAFTGARARRFDFHQVPVAQSWSVILKRSDTPVNALADLDSRRIAILDGGVQERALARMMAGLGKSYTAMEYPNYDAAFAAVRDGEADAVAANNFYAAAFARAYGLRETPVVFNPATLFFAAPRGDPAEVLPAIDAALEAWRYDEDSIYYAALKRAMIPAQEPVVPPLLRQVLYAVGAVVVMLLGLSLLLRWQVRRRTAALHESTRRLDHLLRSSPVVLYQLWSNSGEIATRWVSDNMERLFGFTAARFVAENRWPRQLHAEDRDAVLSNISVLSEKGHLVQEYRILDAQGRTRVVRDEMQYLPGGPGEPDEIVGSWNDLTESRAQAERLSFLAHYDPLTRLPNSALLRERLTQAIYQARREGRSLAVLLIDIDRFKHINDSLGRGAGDAVLREVAERLRRVVRGGENLARIGGDGFVVLMDGEGGRYRADALARSIVESFVDPIWVGRTDLTLTLSVGISLFPGDAGDVDTLLQHAESAMYEAKRTGRNLHQVYSSSLSAGVAERLSIETALRAAVANSELILEYQPQVGLTSRQPVGVEALVRWRHPELGLVTPDRFIPVAEEMGIIGEIGAWVLEEACRMMVAWRAQGLDVPRLAVNLSAPQVDGDTLIPLVHRVLDKTGLDASSLELEVTESIIMREPAKSTAALSGLRELGVRFAVDDFGTGYSSLNYLKHLPIDRLKIDRTFVRDTDTDASSRAISCAIIGLARSLDLETVAEGIEDERQLDFLVAEGCPVGQGFLFSRPVPEDRLTDVWRELAKGKKGGQRGIFPGKIPL